MWIFVVAPLVALASVHARQQPHGHVLPGVGLDPFHARITAAHEALAAGEASAAWVELEGAAQLLSGAPPPELTTALVVARAALGRDEEALEAAVTPSGTSFVLALEEARALARLGRTMEAEQRLGALLVRCEHYGPARLALADLLSRSGRHADASHELDWLTEQAPDDASVRIAAARAAFDVGQTEAALARLEAGARDGPEQERLREAWVDLLLRDGRPTEAHAASLLLVRSGASESALLAAVRASLAADAPLDALRAAAHALDAAPRSTAALDAIAPAVQAWPALAVELARERVRRAPGSASDASLVASLLLARRPADALAHLDTLAPDARPLHRLSRARALRQLGRFDDARAELLSSALDPEAAYELGLVEAGAGNVEAAEHAFARASEGGGALASEAEEARATVLERAQRFADAAAALERALAHDADRPQAWLRLARIARQRLGDRARAVAAYERFFALGGEDPDGRAYLARGASAER